MLGAVISVSSVARVDIDGRLRELIYEFVEVMDVRGAGSLETVQELSTIWILLSKTPCKQEGCCHCRLSDE